MAKKEKRYIESKSDALLLAESIADTQEDKALIKKKHNNERHEDHGNKKKPRSCSDNSRLKKAKEVVRARMAQTKKQKAEMHKAASKPREPSETQFPVPAKKKGVSFAAS